MNDEYKKNLNTALNIYENNYSHEELINMLKNGSDVEKQISALKLEKLTSTEDAQVLIDNLTGRDGKIREAVSFKLKEFMSDNNYIKYFQTQENCNIFLDAITDINGNICRNVISAIVNLKNNEEFCNKFCDLLVNLTTSLIEKIERFNINDGKYKINKEIFKLYWCLEAIYYFSGKINISELTNIISKTKNINEYTIREKTAKILTQNFNNEKLQKYKKELSLDRKSVV